ncbi:MAG TPA: bifunctional chorismate mutase/prephenate dehydratase [Thermoanaerobaculia bacterium]|jgi:chorismate mutase/prephenate dehydratase|nr:bifunctional chorismate mutase/prephenate dehydratase [Thermoanaerobaculia bacterium]
MPEPRDLPTLREAIEEIDRDILAHLRRRMSLVEEVAGAKLRSAYPFRDEPREEQVIQRVRHHAVEQGLDAHEVERLYRVILDMSVAHQKAHVRALADVPLRVAYQGVEGSYSHLTAQRRYAGLPEGVLLEGFETFRAAVEAVRSGAADRALLPIENTTAGSINETYDLLAEGGLTITAEVVSRIEHCLLGLPGSRVENLRVVLSHPQGLLQCQDFLRTVPWIRFETEFDTAGSARKVRDRNDSTVGAIAGESAARVYGLEVLRRGIQSQEGNYTRFVELAHDPIRFPPETPAKTSLLLITPHTPGALAEVLGVFSRRGVNLAKLESRPIPESPWKYRFYLDVDGNADREPLRGALAEVRPLTAELRVLGTYPATEREPAE